MSEDKITNPLQEIISQASTGPQQTGASKRINSHSPISRNLLIIDISGSMNDLIAPNMTKLKVMEDSLSKLPTRHCSCLLFNSTTQWWQGGALPAACGGTAMHLALSVGANIQPISSLVVSDGEPDDPDQALAIAQTMPGSISTLYIGSDSNRNAIGFMRRLAQIGMGSFSQMDINRIKDPVKKLNEQMHRMLPPPG